MFIPFGFIVKSYFHNVGFQIEDWMGEPMEGELKSDVHKEQFAWIFFSILDPESWISSRSFFDFPLFGSHFFAQRKKRWAIYGVARGLRPLAGVRGRAPKRRAPRLRIPD